MTDEREKITDTGRATHGHDARLLTTVLQSSPIAAFAIDARHRVILWNRALERLTGIRASEMLGTDEYWRIFYKEKKELMADLLIEGRAESDMQSLFPGRFQKSDLVDEAYESVDFFPALGSRGKWLRFTASLLRDAEGAVFGALETFEDISERMLAEELYIKLANNSPVGIFVAQNGKFIFTNIQFQKSTGYSPEELQGKSVLSLVHSRDRAAARRNALEMLKGSRIAPYEFRIRTKQGETRWIMETVTSITFGGEKAVLGTTWMFRSRKSGAAISRSSGPSRPPSSMRSPTPSSG